MTDSERGAKNALIEALNAVDYKGTEADEKGQEMVRALQLTDTEKGLLSGPAPDDFDADRVWDGNPANDHERLVMKIVDHSIRAAVNAEFSRRMNLGTSTEIGRCG